MDRGEREENVLIIGDSILRHCYPPRGVYRRSFSGATIVYLLERLASPNSEIDLRRYELIIIHVGSNDIDNGSINYFLADYKMLINHIRNANPICKIIISAVIPRPRALWKTTQDTVRANQLLKRYAARKGYLHFHTTYTSFMRHRRPIHRYYDNGGLHLNEDGSEILTRVLINLIRLWEQGRLSFW